MAAFLRSLGVRWGGVLGGHLRSREWSSEGSGESLGALGSSGAPLKAYDQILCFELLIGHVVSWGPLKDMLEVPW